MNKYASYSPVLLRIGISLVFLWFGYSQVSDQVQWVAYVPEWLPSMLGIQVETFVKLNGIFELVFGIALLAGFWTRTASLLLGLHMLEITHVVGFDATGVRDFGLSIATLAIFLHGRDRWSVDTLIAPKDEVLK
ncbi:MAG: DoxX family protein [Patescibacteria group bacterium]